MNKTEREQGEKKRSARMYMYTFFFDIDAVYKLSFEYDLAKERKKKRLSSPPPLIYVY